MNAREKKNGEKRSIANNKRYGEQNLSKNKTHTTHATQRVELIEVSAADEWPNNVSLSFLFFFTLSPYS